MQWARLFLVMCISIAAARAEDPIDVGERKQLFIDNRFIASSEGIALRMNQAQKLGLVLDEQGKPLEFHGHASRVIEDQDKVRLYLGSDSVVMFESDDGLHFRRTDVVVGGGILTTVFLDPHDPDPARRYKAFYVRRDEQKPFNPETDGVYASYSADGVNFTEVGRVLPFYIDNPTVVSWDERIGKYVIYTRSFDYSSENQRRIGRIETEDPLKPWPYTPREDDKERLGMHNVPLVHSTDAEDNPHSDFYYNAATIYPWAQDVYFLFTAPFRHFSPDRNPALRPPKGGWEDFGLLEVQMAVSRDGIEWQRPSREPYFPLGLADEWDRWYAVMAPGMIRRGNYIYQYYVSTGRTHDSAYVRPEYETTAPRMGGFGVVRQRLDGFVSADADHRGGWLQTPLIKFSGNRLRLNIDTNAMGTALVELRDAEGHSIPGFTLAECEEIGGNYIDEVVHWKGNADVSSLAGKPVRVHIKLILGKLYGFQFTSE